MSAASWLQFVVLDRGHRRHRRPARPLHGPGLRRRRARRRVTASSCPIERLIYRICRVDPTSEQRWTVYAYSLLGFSIFSFLAVYALQRFQGVAAAQPDRLPAVVPHLSFNTAVSFMTNTNWQSYGGEATMSHLTQMVGLAVQNFVSAAAGMATVAALIRGLSRRRAVDDRQLLGRPHPHRPSRILLPLSLVVRARPREPGRDPELQRLHRRRTTVEGGDRAAHPGRPGGEPDRHQAARHQRRRVLQHELGAPVREHRRRSTTSSRCGRSWSSRSRSPSRSGTWSRTAARAAPCSPSCSSSGSACRSLRDGASRATATRASTDLGADQAATSDAGGREHGGQGGPLRPGRLRPVGGVDDRHVERLGQLDARQLHAAGRWRSRSAT